MFNFLDIMTIQINNSSYILSLRSSCVHEFLKIMYGVKQENGKEKRERMIKKKKKKNEINLVQAEGMKRRLCHYSI